MDTKKLNTYLANLLVQFVKIHNLHWNVRGPQAVAVHKMTDELYEQVSERYDAVAELLKMKGEMPLATVREYMKVATLKEVEPREFCSSEVLRVLHEDFSFMKKLAIEIHDEAECFCVTNLMEDHIADYDKTLWFLSMEIAPKCGN